jgi:hypothetical protein
MTNRQNHARSLTNPRRNLFAAPLAALSALAAAALSGCGGGGEDVDYFGAIAVNSLTRAAGISANYTSQNEANARANSECGSGCSVVATFGNGMCGALARGSDFAVGYAVASTKSQAESNAQSQCRSVGGISCVVRLSECNG